MTDKQLTRFRKKDQMRGVGFIIPLSVLWIFLMILMVESRNYLLFGGIFVLIIERIFKNHIKWKLSQKQFLIAVRSNKWKPNGFLVILFGFQIYSNREDISLIAALIAMIILMILSIIGDLKQVQYLTPFGLYEIPTFRKILDPSKITKITISEHQISIDTTKYRNEFVYNSKMLKQPDWQKLLKYYAELQAVWLPDGNEK